VSSKAALKFTIERSEGETKNDKGGGGDIFKKEYKGVTPYGSGRIGPKEDGVQGGDAEGRGLDAQTLTKNGIKKRSQEGEKRHRRGGGKGGCPPGKGEIS